MKKNRRMMNFLFILAVLIATAPLFAFGGWKFQTAMVTPRSGFSAVVFNGKIYVIGGRDNTGRVLDSVERYDPVSDQWEVGLPALRTARENASAVVFDGKIFLLGGRSAENEILRKVEVFEASENKWLSFQEMEEEREGLTTAVLGGVLYAIGGFGEYDGHEYFSKTVEYYDPEEQQWRVFSYWELEAGRASFATVTVQDSAFSIGGFRWGGPLAVVQRYHVTAGAEERSSLSPPRGGLAATAIGDTIIVLGGRSESDMVINTVEYFVPKSNRWLSGLPLNIARENFAAVTVGNRVYALGGLDNDGHTLASVEVANTADIVTDISVTEPMQPEDFVLQQNYPNPFNAGTKISFQVPENYDLSMVELSIYNLQGQVLRTLVTHKLTSGNYEFFWDGKDRDGLAVASAMYLYTLRVGEVKITKKMTLIR